ncbi:hypothetical protein VZ95_18585, partial [Elstera litoralis]
IDALYFQNSYVWDLMIMQNGNDMVLYDIADANDNGAMDYGVVLKDWYLGGGNTVEYLIDATGSWYLI